MFMSERPISSCQLEIVLAHQLTFKPVLEYAQRMLHRILALLMAAVLPGLADLKSGPPMNYSVVEDWAQLPKGWNFGECSGVDVDKSDNVWVFNRGPHPVIEFDKSGKMLQAWSEVPLTSAHGIRVGPDGNIWLVDVAAHRVMKFTPAGRLLMMIGQVGGSPGPNNDTKDGFNRPTNLAFTPNGDFFVSDGYVNSRVVKFKKNGEYQVHWGQKGTGDGEFNLVHDVALDSQGVCMWPTGLISASRFSTRMASFSASGPTLARRGDSTMCSATTPSTCATA